MNCGIIDTSCICFIKSAPYLSAGCAFPANTNTTGLSVLFNICVILSKSLNINVALLYVANLLENPIVKAFGSNFDVISFISL